MRGTLQRWFKNLEMGRFSWIIEVDPMSQGLGDVIAREKGREENRRGRCEDRQRDGSDAVHEPRDVSSF